MAEFGFWIGFSTCGLAGAVAAHLCPPPVIGWPTTSNSLLRRRIGHMRCATPGRARQWAGAVAVGLILATGCATAYAAAPGAPEGLPSEVVGVTGSGDRLTLELREAGGGTSSLKPGDVDKDGWTLESVTPTQATLSKAGARQTVGLNPAGVVAPAAASLAPSQVTVIGAPDAAIIEKYYQARLAPYGGTIDGMLAQGLMTRLETQVLSPDELKRSLAYAGMINEEIDRRRNAAPANGAGASPPNQQDLRALLGEGGLADMNAISAKLSTAASAQLAARGIVIPPAP